VGYFREENFVGRKSEGWEMWGVGKGWGVRKMKG
jgi:hypothetical protein